MLHTALVDARPGVIGWLPSHLTNNELGRANKSDGTLVLVEELAANDLADKLAKRGVEFHRVAPTDVKQWEAKAAIVEEGAIWAAKATVLANNSTRFPFPRFGGSQVEGGGGYTKTGGAENGNWREEKKTYPRELESQTGEWWACSGTHGDW